VSGDARMAGVVSSWWTWTQRPWLVALRPWSRSPSGRRRRTRGFDSGPCGCGTAGPRGRGDARQC